ncbi:MAG: pyrroline-5-carboxylate reductase dimerization domain-containing protein [Prevotella sp.]|nr:pyrroline-5-carboxylate reductase dimerization domain-containing protein [Prevotella sp.]
MKITIIGAGAMGGAFARGLLKGEVFRPEDITLTAAHEATLRAFETTGVRLTTDNSSAVDGADIIAIVVKPWVVKDVLIEVAPHLDASRQILVNMAASVKADDIYGWLGFKMPLFQVIPNIAIAVRSSMTFIVPVNADDAKVGALLRVFNDVGRSLLTDERHLPAGMALASCGLAYAMRYVRASAEGGVELGFKADLAKDIVVQTLRGVAELLQASGNHPEAEIDKVTTPGGLTIRGLNAMEAAGFTNAVIQGLKAGL